MIHDHDGFMERESLKKHIEDMPYERMIDIYYILLKRNEKFTRNSNGVFFEINDLSDETVNMLQGYVLENAHESPTHNHANTSHHVVPISPAQWSSTHSHTVVQTTNDDLGLDTELNPRSQLSPLKRVSPSQEDGSKPSARKPKPTTVIPIDSSYMGVLYAINTLHRADMSHFNSFLNCVKKYNKRETKDMSYIESLALEL